MKWNKGSVLLLTLIGMASFITHAQTPRENVSAEPVKSILKIDDFLPENKNWSFGTGGKHHK